MMIRFQSYPAVRALTFTCACCGKPKRTKTIRVECTVNPYNKGEDGHVLSPVEVRDQSHARVDREARAFLAKPFCAACEGRLSWSESIALHDERRAALHEDKPHG